MSNRCRFDDFAYFYHRYDLPRLNYTLCTDPDMNHLHKQFLPPPFWKGSSKADLDTLHHLLQKPMWQVSKVQIALTLKHIRNFNEGWKLKLLQRKRA